MTLAGRVSPFRHPRITACLPTPRGFSQAATSFFAFDCLGIHRLRLLTYPRTQLDTGSSLLRSRSQSQMQHTRKSLRKQNIVYQVFTFFGDSYYTRLSVRRTVVRPYHKQARNYLAPFLLYHLSC